MKSEAYFLTKYGSPQDSFELRTFELSTLKADEVLIEVETFGLNYADVMARKGLYKPAPKPPGIIGYEVVGKIIQVASEHDHHLLHKKVLSFTRFGAYARHAITSSNAVVIIENQNDNAKLSALATQYSTAYYAVYLCANLLPNQWILQHAAAGGVGLAILEMSKALGVKSIGLTSNASKADLLYSKGINHVINYKTTDYVKEVKRLTPQGVHCSFNSVAGDTVKKDMQLLQAGGALILYGAAQRAANKKGLWPTLKLVWQMGFFSPIQLMMHARGMTGVNMLVLADKQPELLQYCMQAVMKLYNSKHINPLAMSYSHRELAEAHHLLESGQSVGKLAINW